MTNDQRSGTALKSREIASALTLDESDLLMWPQTADEADVLPDPQTQPQQPYCDWWDRFGYYGGPSS